MERPRPSVRERFSQHLQEQEEERNMLALLATFEKEDQSDRSRRSVPGPLANRPPQLPKTVSVKKKRESSSQGNSNSSNSFNNYLRVKQSKIKASVGDCGICLSELSKRPARLECNHTFCLQCLETWLKQCSKCPFCRKECQWMMVDNHRIEIEPKAQMEEDEDIICYICQQNVNDDQLLICDICDYYVCHAYCDRDLLRMPAEHEEWYCHICSSRNFQGQSGQQNNGYELDGFVVADEENSEQEDYYQPRRRYR